MSPSSSRPTQPGSVRLEGALLKVNASWSDPEVVLAAGQADKRGVPLDHWLAAVVRSGIAAASVASTGHDLTQLEHAVQAVGAQVQASVDTALSRLSREITRVSDPSTGQIAEAAQAAVTRLAMGVQTLLLGEQAVLPTTVRASVETVTAQALGEIQRALAAQTLAVQQAVSGDRDAVSASVATATTALTRDVTSALAQLRSTLATSAAVAEVEARTSRKGLAYERAAWSVLSEIASNAGDTGAVFTGGTPGARGTRVGDAVVEFAGSGQRLVMEAKNRAEALTLDAWRTELAQARANRGAAVGCGMTPSHLMPTPGQLITILGPRDVVVAWDPDGQDDQLVTVVYLILRRLADVGEGQADIADAVQVLQDLRDELRGWVSLDRHAGAAVKSAMAVVTDARQLRQGLEAHLQRLAHALQAEPSPASQPTREDAPDDEVARPEPVTRLAAHPTSAINGTTAAA